MSGKKQLNELVDWLVGPGEQIFDEARLAKNHVRYGLPLPIM